MLERINTHLRLIKSLAGNRNFWLVVLADICLVVLAHYLSYSIRFEDQLHQRLNQFFINLPLLIGVKITVFYIFGLYRGMWRYTSLLDLLHIIEATVTASVIIIVLILYTKGFTGFSRSVFILDTLLTFLFISGHRIAIRYYYQNAPGTRRLSKLEVNHEKKRLLLIGAGDAAEKVIREVHDNNALPYKVVGIVDDDPHKTGLKIHGIPVVGLTEDLLDHVKRFTPEELLISIASATAQQMKRLVSLCQDSKIPFKVLPGLGELIGGKVSIKTIRDISYRDLLGREEVRLEQDKIGRYLTGRTVLITGAGGSIGSELCRQVTRFRPERIILFDAGEENLYAIQMELRHEYNMTSHVAILGKVQDQRLLNSVFKQYQPAVVFHAAAYKHVPLVENNPWEAVYNNVIASMLLIETSIAHGVERFVLVSTDKAVRPTNVMGASKRLTELLMLAYGKKRWDGSFCSALSQIREAFSQICTLDAPKAHNTIFMAVRFGNVLGSSGSVIPLFKRQIEMGGPVTVTHPEITRFFMSIEEAAQLILQAGAMGEGEEIFILKMGEPIQIAKMARDLIKLAGREPDTEIEIKFTGLREGEKLYEELITEGEGIVETGHEKIMVLRGDGKSCEELGKGLEQLVQKARELDGQAIKNVLRDLIPEYTPVTMETEQKN
jgi:FlaA1/EpsC-like NDP-sugar epimerase